MNDIFEGRINLQTGEVTGSWLDDETNLDPLTALPRPKPVGNCAVCQHIVLPEDAPVPIEFVEGGEGYIHGSMPCMDRPVCDETRQGTSSSGDWDTHCLRPLDHPGECYWAEL